MQKVPSLYPGVGPYKPDRSYYVVLEIALTVWASKGNFKVS